MTIDDRMCLYAITQAFTQMQTFKMKWTKSKCELSYNFFEMYEYLQ